MFRNPSLTIETSGDEPFPPVRPSSSGESLALNPRGVTFAARARAAELQAARSRREYKSRSTDISTPHETMTFKKGAKKRWNPLDLSSLPDPGPSSSDSLSEASQFPAKAGSTTSYERELSLPEIQERHEKETTSSGQTLRRITSADILSAEPESDIEYPESSPCPTPRCGQANQKALDPVKITSSPVASTTRISGKENTATFARSLPPVSLNPVPVLSSSSNSIWDRDKTAELIKQQETQIAQLTAQLRAQNIEKLHATSASKQFSNTAQTGPVGPKLDQNPRAVPQKQYPAVKGTSENTVRPTLTLRPPPGLEYQAFPSRRTSEDERTFLLRHLNSVVDTKPNNHHDAPAVETEADIDHAASRKELLESSEPLPWKDRRVPIAFPPHPSYQAYMDRPKTPQKPIPFWASPTRSPEKKSREEELEDWWTRDNRVDLRFKAEVDEYIKAEEAKRANQKKAEKAALQAANFSDERANSMPKEDYDYKEEGAICRSLLLPVLENLAQYRNHPNGPFDRHALPPSWAIDHTPQGNDSFFSQGWGIPPSRVGRDPRYRTVQHDGRSSVFEDPTGKWPREEYNRHGWW